MRFPSIGCIHNRHYHDDKKLDHILASDNQLYQGWLLSKFPGAHKAIVDVIGGCPSEPEAWKVAQSRII